MAQREQVYRKIVPPRPVRGLAHEAAVDLRRSLDVIEAWMKKPMPAISRPYAALKVLDEVAGTARFTYEQRGDHDAIRALQLAFDLREIAATLPDTLVADLRKALETCARGPLDPPPEERAPVQAQSELIVRAAYARAGENPRQLTHSGSGGRTKPDILLENGMSTYGVEVKRPTRIKNVRSRAKDAAKQLATARYPGGIVIDLTDCVVDTGHEGTDDALKEQAVLAGALFFEHGKGWQPGCRHILMLTVMARPTWHVALNGENEGYVIVQSTSVGLTFGAARGTLDDIRAHWLRGQLQEGLNQLGLTSFEGSAYRGPPPLPASGTTPPR